MAVHYPEFMKSVSAEKGCQVGSIDLGGALTYQGPLTKQQQAKLVTLFTEVSTENEGILKEVSAAMAVKVKEAEAKQTAKPKTPPAKK